MKDIFLIANGPSLNDLDLSLLKNKWVFALNRGYLKLKDDLDHIDYLAVVNPYVENQFRGDFIELIKKGVKLFSNNLPGFHYKFTPDIPSFSCNINKPIWQGHTVTYVALQTICYYQFDRVFIIGLDHYFNYDNTEKKDGILITKGSDLSHFDPNYFGDGIKWEPANLKMSELAYKLANENYLKLGKKIYNCSSKTNLPDKIFERMDYYKAIEESNDRG